MSRRLLGRDHAERGSATLEMVILAPGLILLIGLLIVGIRVSWAHNAVESAAGAGARSASLERTDFRAQAAATNAAAQSMQQSGATCAGQATMVDTSGFNAPLGEAGRVSVTLTCNVPVDNLVPGIGGSMTVTKTAASPVDPYRQR